MAKNQSQSNSHNPNLKIIDDLYARPGTETRPQFRLSRLLVACLALAVVSGLVSGFIGVALLLSGSLEGIGIFKNFQLASVLPEQQVIIKNQQAVTVTLDKQLENLLMNVEPTMVTLVRYKVPTGDLPDIYLNSDVLSFGTVLTADGWLALPGQAVVNQNVGLLRIITHDGAIHQIESMVTDELSSIAFMRIVARDLLTAPLAETAPVNPDFSLVTVEKSLPSFQTVLRFARIRQYNETALVMSSEELPRSYALIDVPEQFKPAPVYNLAGEVMGFASVSETTLEPLVIPVFHFRSLLEGLLRNGVIDRPLLGVKWLNLHGAIGLPTELGQGFGKGAYITEVKAGSPAAVSGLRAGDIITKINDLELNGRLVLSELIQTFKPGTEIFVDVWRQTETLEFTVQLGQMALSL